MQKKVIFLLLINNIGFSLCQEAFDVTTTVPVNTFDPIELNDLAQVQNVEHDGSIENKGALKLSMDTTENPEPNEQKNSDEIVASIFENHELIKQPQGTVENETSQDSNITQKQVSCITTFGSQSVQIVNDTELIKFLRPNVNITSKRSLANCIAVLFYSKHCPFSSIAAPHFNALPRAFPDIKMLAINAMIYHMLNAQNGIVGVPSLLLFHNGRLVAKFNESEYTLERFSRFLTKHTAINALQKSFVTSADFVGPVSSVPTRESDIFLYISWSFIIICAIYYFTRSKLWLWFVESVKRNWRDSEVQAHHEHNE